MELKFKKLHPDATLPTYGTDGAAALDLYAVADVTNSDGHPVGVAPGFPQVVNTGVAVEVPEGHVMLIFSRSGHGFKENVRLANCVGVIDSDFRGELKAKLVHDGEVGYALPVKRGDRIAQAIVLPIPKLEPVFVEELSSTVRGENGFGSTGA